MPHQANRDRVQDILSTLSEWQYLRPHRPLSDVIADAVAKLGICPDAAQRAVDRLEMDASHPVGRLRATELTQLARCMQRMWDAAEAMSQQA
jgi:hypothetical protein